MSDSLQSFTETVRSKVGEDAGLKATIKFAFTDPAKSPPDNLTGEVLYIDGKSKPNAVHNDDVPADCTVKVSLEDFGKLMSRKLDPTTAFMMGKVKIEGDMGIAMKLGRVFG